MKYLLMIVALAALALGATVPEQPVLRYHEAVGIPAAARIKQAEQAVDFDGSRIVGGSTAAAGTHPYLVGVVITLTSGATSVCSATMLTNYRCITTAQCWSDGQYQARQFTLVFGTAFLFFGGDRVSTDNVIVHEDFNPTTLINNLAIAIHGFVPFSGLINRAPLPSGNLLSETFVGVWAQASGYGRTSDSSGISTIQSKSHVSLQVITNAECAQTYGTNMIVDSTLCTSGAGGVSTCGGDAGGPLVLINGNERVLIGVTSYSSARGCELGLPAAFSRITSFLSWINARI